MNIAIDLNRTTDLLSRIHHDVLGDHRPLTRPRESSPTELARARDQWSARASAAYFTQGQITGLIQRLMAAAAPVEVLSAAIDALQDHHRHMVWCASIAESVGATQSAALSADRLMNPREDESPWLAIALDGLNIFGFNFSLSIPYFDAIGTISSDGLLSEISEQIGDDLNHHSEFGWALLQWLMPKLDATDRALLDHAIIPMMSVYETLCFAGPEVLDDLAGQAITVEAEETNLGTLSATQHAAIFYHAMTETLFPRLETLGLDPVEAWHKHYRSDEPSAPRAGSVIAVRCYA